MQLCYIKNQDQNNLQPKAGHIRGSLFKPVTCLYCTGIKKKCFHFSSHVPVLNENTSEMKDVLHILPFTGRNSGTFELLLPINLHFNAVHEELNTLCFDWL